MESSAASSAPSSVMMETILSPDTWPHWQSEILSTDGPERLTEGSVVDGAARLLGFDVTGRSITATVRDDLFEEDVIVGVQMRISYRVAPQGSGSIVTRRMDADLPGGVAGRLLSTLLRWRLKKMQTSLLDRLRAQAEGASR